MYRIVEIADLSFSYGKTKVLDITQFNLEAGEKLFLYGPSGSGKSTLLNLIAGVLRPAGGALQVLANDYSNLSSEECDSLRGREMGIIFQQFNLIPYLTGEENILLLLTFSKSNNPHARERLHELTKQLGIDKLLKEKVRHLSIGQQQRMAMARALINQPKLIIADEPTSSLDEENANKFMELLMNQCQDLGASLIFVSHHRPLERYFDRQLSLLAINKAKGREYVFLDA